MRLLCLLICLLLPIQALAFQPFQVGSTAIVDLDEVAQVTFSGGDLVVTWGNDWTTFLVPQAYETPMIEALLILAGPRQANGVVRISSTRIVNLEYARLAWYTAATDRISILWSTGVQENLTTAETDSVLAKRRGWLRGLGAGGSNRGAR